MDSEDEDLQPVPSKTKVAPDVEPWSDHSEEDEVVTKVTESAAEESKDEPTTSEATDLATADCEKATQEVQATPTQYAEEPEESQAGDRPFGNVQKLIEESNEI